MKLPPYWKNGSWPTLVLQRFSTQTTAESLSFKSSGHFSVVGVVTPHSSMAGLVIHSLRALLNEEIAWLQGDHSPGKPGKVREFQSGQGKVREAEICFIVQLTYL